MGDSQGWRHEKAYVGLLVREETGEGRARELEIRSQRRVDDVLAGGPAAPLCRQTE